MPKKPTYEWAILAFRADAKSGSNEIPIFSYGDRDCSRFNPRKKRLIYVKKVVLSLSGHITSLARFFYHSTVTDFARLRGLSTSVPRANAV